MKHYGLKIYNFIKNNSNFFLPVSIVYVIATGWAIYLRDIAREMNEVERCRDIIYEAKGNRDLDSLLCDDECQRHKLIEKISKGYKITNLEEFKEIQKECN